MKSTFVCAAAGVCALSVAACSKSPATAVAPSPASVTTATATANPDGSTVKATPPVPASPINGTTPDQAQSAEGITLVVNNSESKFGVGLPVSYRFELYNPAGQLIETSDNMPAGALQSSYTIKSALDADQTYSWRARAEVNNGEYVGTWSAKATFVAPSNDGYIRGNELYDPLVNGKTVGAISGPVSFIPGLGLKIETQLSYVAYVLPQTLNDGAFSIIVTNLAANTDGDKTKMFAMSEGFDDLITNNRRLTVEKRGDPEGIIAWRMISNGDQVDAEGAERTFYPFKTQNTYVWTASWANNRFEVTIKDGGPDGKQIYGLSKNYKGRLYDPNPHVAFLGAPVGRSGPTAASVDGMIIRQVWISNKPRPAFAKK